MHERPTHRQRERSLPLLATDAHLARSTHVRACSFACAAAVPLGDNCSLFPKMIDTHDLRVISGTYEKRLDFAP